jgi:geranylgeranyl pyrophosphate synthase
MKPLPLEQPEPSASSPLDSSLARGPTARFDDLQDTCAEHGIDPQHLERALYGSAREFLARPGKAFRARLIESCFRLAGGAEQSVPRAALEAIEVLHAGSLIVDDIQDDAETRRGAPALHRSIGTPRALNTGNWLYFVALNKLDTLTLTPEVARELGACAHRCLLRCHEGQALDLALAVGDLRRAELASTVSFISALKTGALTGFAAQVGATAAGASPRVVSTLASFGRQVGVVLQMLDDLGSFVSETRHHKALEDLRGQRASWVWAWASETLDEHTYRQLLKLLVRDGELSALRERLSDAVEPLGRLRVHEALERAKRELAPLLASPSLLEALHADLDRLEHSYG